MLPTQTCCSQAARWLPLLTQVLCMGQSVHTRWPCRLVATREEQGCKGPKPPK